MTLEELKATCLTHGMPIMSDAALNYTTQLINQQELGSVLELGSCWGYSAITIAEQTKASIISLERDLNRHTQARYHVKTMALEDRIEMVYDDALVYQPQQNFDLILIDAAKAQNQAFVDRYYDYLKDGGYMVIDNTEFHGLVFEDTISSKSLKTMIQALQAFHQSIKEDFRFESEFLSLGDGLIVLKKKI